jgi:CIC family chloride channel protein
VSNPSKNSPIDRRQRFTELWRALFLLIAKNRALPFTALWGLGTGVSVGLLVVAFEIAVAKIHQALWPATTSALVINGETTEQFVAVTWWQTALIPLGGALFIGLIFTGLPKRSREAGVAHVIERIMRHDAVLPFRNAIAHFFGAIVALASGFSVGREGPAIHMGATLANWPGRFGFLPSNLGRLLAASGAAAAVAASFNTPLAGVILAMEVVLMEYSIAGFAPVMLSAVGATVVTQYFHGSVRTFSVPPLELASLWELPWLALLGFVLGILAHNMVRLLDSFSRMMRNSKPWLRALVAGLITAAGAILVPQAMGLGYDSVNTALVGQMTVTAAFALLVAKLFMSTAAIGLGIPGGLIGPSVVIGAMAGTVIGWLGQFAVFAHTSPIAFYALVGMGTMMGAVLQAPLAAITAMLELTGNPNVILPGMFALMSGYITQKVIFQDEPLFLHVLSLRGIKQEKDARLRALQQTSVAAASNTNVMLLPSTVSVEVLREATKQTDWILARRARQLYRSTEIREWLNSHEEELLSGSTILLDKLPITAFRCRPIHAGASMWRAFNYLKTDEYDALYVRWPKWRLPRGRIQGVITRDTLSGEVKLDYCPL